MRNFFTDQDGVVAIIFAIVAIPFIALGGWGVDYLRLYHVHDGLQAAADAAVLNAMVEDADPDAWRGVMRGGLEARYGSGTWASNLAIDGAWMSGTDFRVTARADVPLTFMNLIPGVPSTQRVSVEAIGRLTEPDFIFEPPEFADLDPEAGDYNRIWLYCYWPDRPSGVANAPQRTQMVPIADNGGSSFDADEATQGAAPFDADLRDEWETKRDLNENGLDGLEDGVWRMSASGGQRDYLYLMPSCGAGSYLSYRLENVRQQRTNKSLWDAGGERYNYHTDSEMVAAGPEIYHDLIHPTTGLEANMLETVLCESMEECRGVSDGGIIPSGKDREPQQATEGCQPGKYMYYGWEDRPPGQPGPANDWTDFAWTDSDFDDIRVIIKCPIQVQQGDRVARLVG